MARIRPSVFIGSSTNGLAIAKNLQILLDHSCEVTIWSQGVFGLSTGTLESLVNSLDKFDFAILALTPDDLKTCDGDESTTPRDNVIFELGLFMGGLGRNRTFIVYDRTAKIKLPTDLAGVTPATFEPHLNGNLKSSLGAAASLCEEQISRLGLRDTEHLKSLSEAATEFDNVSIKMHRLIKLLARSRKVELAIVSNQFGTFISPEHLSSIKQDLSELEDTLVRE